MRITDILKLDIFGGRSANFIDEYVGTKLRMKRSKISISQEKLADTTNVTFQQIQKYESGKNRISASRLYQFSVALKVPVTYFFEGLDDVLKRKYISKPVGASDNEQEDFSFDFDENPIDKKRYRDKNKMDNLFDELTETERKTVIDVAKTFAKNQKK